MRRALPIRRAVTDLGINRCSDVPVLHRFPPLSGSVEPKDKHIDIGSEDLAYSEATRRLDWEFFRDAIHAHKMLTEIRK